MTEHEPEKVQNKTEALIKRQGEQLKIQASEETPSQKAEDAYWLRFFLAVSTGQVIPWPDQK